VKVDHRSCCPQPQDAIEKLRWYAMRWKIETFHKILKSGFKAEEVRLRAAERIVNLLAILCLLSWRIFWMTMMNRTMPEAAPELAFTTPEIYLLDQLVSDNRARDHQEIRSPCISPNSLASEAISHVPRIPRRETSSCGEVSHASPISNWAF
jgi:hypothetical protein